MSECKHDLPEDATFCLACWVQMLNEPVRKGRGEAMSEWRPDGWDNPYNGQAVRLASKTPTIICGTFLTRQEIYEAGADAILEALREEHPQRINANKDIRSINFPMGLLDGVFVFIPDEGEICK